ncbi:MAG: Nucleoside triphosphate pyrophosphohydrolase/pyrophosphatase MazG [Candidatus Dichloromethanomonas elyunquensis]|nr:MAG: Nucleoside triphosphate pyrophosphohydrolase/pyrophosphatase MazG [Candidatus Dichloromethanomonas elyunquensis]
MKPIVWIIGLGSGGLNKLTLETYRILDNADVIFLWSFEHPAATDMMNEGFHCEELFASSGEMEVGGWESVIETAEKRLRASRFQLAVAALPGDPLREGKIVSGLQQALDDCYTVDTSLLAKDDSLDRLTTIMKELRSDRGCPWDKEQTHESLKKYIIEETYEVIDAIDSKYMNNFCEELGDLLLQIVFHTQIAEEAKHFTLSNVLTGISDKLIRRHPHVFGAVIAESSEEVLINWDAIKKKEKSSGGEGKKDSADYFSIPKDLPALMMAEASQKKAAMIGFDWGNYLGPLAKIHEEIKELEMEIGNRQRLEDELGDLLFSVVNLSRFVGINAEEALRKATKKFQKRFLKMMEEIEKDGLVAEELGLSKLDSYWDKIKIEEKPGTLGSI